MLSCSQWLVFFRGKRINLDVRRSAALYRLQVSSQEFDSLQLVLRGTVQTAMQARTFVNLPQATEFAACFVLYGAEWWRRRYDGTGWKWESILTTIGIDPPDLLRVNDRSDLVTRGLQFWGRRITTGGFTYLGSLAIEGGLPLQAVSNGRGGISHVLLAVIRAAGGSGALSEEALEGWVEAYKSWLPGVYQRAEIIRLLAQVAASVLALKVRYNLTDPKKAIEELDKQHADWREEFPLPLADEQVKALLEQLVQVSVATKVRASERIRIDRVLVGADGPLELQSRIDLPEFISTETLGKLLYPVKTSNQGQQQIPREFEIRITAGETERSVKCVNLIGRQEFRLGNRIRWISQYDACQEHTFEIVRRTGECERVSPAVRGAGALVEDLPWLFEVPDGDDQPPRLVRQGSGSVASEYGVAVVPCGWITAPENDADVQEAELKGSERKVLRFKGALRLAAADGAIFRVSTQQATPENEWIWHGSTVHQVRFLNPDYGFRWPLKLWSVQEDGDRTLITALTWKHSGQTITNPSQQAGPLEASWSKNDILLFRDKVVVLPENARLEVDLKADHSAQLRFFDWDLAFITSETESVEIVRQAFESNDPQRVVVDIRYTGPDSPPENIVFLGTWRKNRTSASFEIRYPVSGARVFDKKGRALASGDRVSLQNLYGLRMVAYSDGSPLELNFHLCMESSWGPVERPGPYLKEHLCKNERKPIRLSNYMSTIRNLLSEAALESRSGRNQLNATVKVSLRCGKGPTAELHVRRFDAELERIEGAVALQMPEGGIVDEAAVRPLACRIDAPAEEPIALAPRQVGGGGTTVWSFGTKLEPGPWLIYPPEQSPICYRPMLWTIEGGDGGNTALEPPLHALLRISDEWRRRQELKSKVGALVEDFRHEDWTYLEHLATRFRHIPLATFDIWSVFARSEAGCAALAVRKSSFAADFLTRFAYEFPVVWELVRIDTWVRAYQKRAEQDLKTVELEAAMVQENRAMRTRRPSLDAITEYALQLATQKAKIYPASQQQFLRKNLEGKHSSGATPEAYSLQRLLCDRAEDVWPTWSLVDQVVDSHEFDRYTFVGYAEHRKSVINLPILLGVATAQNRAFVPFEDDEAIRQIRKFEAFSPDWFAEAFWSGVAQCISAGESHKG